MTFLSRRTIKYLVPPFVFLIIVLFIALSYNDRTIGLNQIEYKPDFYNYLVDDFDGDGEVELAAVNINRFGLLVSEFGRDKPLSKTIADIRKAFYIHRVFSYEIDTLPGRELFFLMKDSVGDSSWIEVQNLGDPEILCRTAAVRGKDISEGKSEFPGAWDGAVDWASCRDLDNDGTPEIVATAATGYDCYPRGVYVYDYPAGTLRWHFLTAGRPGRVEFGDADGNDRQEIYYKTWNPGNGCVVDSTADTTSYLYALDFDGRLIWQHLLGERFGLGSQNFLIGDMDRDDTLDIYCTSFRRARDFEGHIRFLEKRRARDNHLDRVRPFASDWSYIQLWSGDIDGNGREEIFIDGRTGLLSPDDLSSLKKGVLNNCECGLIDNIDDDKQGRQEIIVHAGDTLYILDHNLQIIIARRLENISHIYYVRHFRNPYGKNMLALVARHAAMGTGTHSLRIYEIIPAEKIQPPRVLAPFISTPVIAVILGFYILGVLITGRRTGGSDREWPGHLPPAARRSDLNSLIPLLPTIQPDGAVSAGLDRLATAAAGLKKDDSDPSRGEKDIPAEIGRYRDDIAPALDGILNKLTRVKKLRSLSGRIRKAKKTLDRLGAAGIVGQESRELTRLTSAIKKDLARADRYIRLCYAADVLKILKEVINAAAKTVRQQGIVIEPVQIGGDITRAVFFSEPELKTILEELISNACRAMTDSELKKLHITLEYGSEHARLKITDTGAGIGKVEQERIFSRDFTTKSGGGYGLYHARQQVQRFGGAISILNNDPPPGAMVELELNTVQAE